MSKIRLVEADTFSITVGATTLRISSESAVLRARVHADLGLEPGDAPGPDGLLVGRPHADGDVGRAQWVVYESGDIVLRRSRHEADAVQAACYHLHALQAALASGLLALRVRTILLPDGTALLADADALHDLAGHDRRLAGRRCLVLPTTIAVVDPASAHVVLRAQTIDPSIPSGTYPISRVLLLGSGEHPITDIDALLAITRPVLRTADADLDLALGHIGQFISAHTNLVEMLPHTDIVQRVKASGGRPD